MHELSNKTLTSRLRRLIGHLQGIEKMINEDRPCRDVVHQLHACEAAIHKLKRAVAGDHIQHCLLPAVADGQDRNEELLALLEKL